MKRFWLLGFITLLYWLLASCATPQHPINVRDFTNERWMQLIDTNPNNWVSHADNWFLRGEPTELLLGLRHAPYSNALSSMNVRVPNFTRLKIQGDFQVQIMGSYNSNRVVIEGSNIAVRGIAVDIRGDTLCITQTKDAPPCVRSVIVRIRVCNLNELIYAGHGKLEGVQLNSNHLAVISMGPGNIYLTGHVNLDKVCNLGSGCISIFGVNACHLDIETLGNGHVNISGGLALHSIKHHGNGNINIIGACNGPPVRIYTDGSGKIGICGTVNLREVIARQFTCVYINRVYGGSLNAVATDGARIGLAGSSGDFYATTSNAAMIQAGHLCAFDVYARAGNQSHINVAANNKIFAVASQSGSIYFFGSPSKLSRFTNGNGVIIPIGYGYGTSCSPSVPACLPPPHNVPTAPLPCYHHAPVYKGRG